MAASIRGPKCIISFGGQKELGNQKKNWMAKAEIESSRSGMIESVVLGTKLEGSSLRYANVRGFIGCCSF